MRSKYILFFAFIFILYFIFLRVNFSEIIKQKENKPNFVLLGADINHFIQGGLELKVNAEKIEVYDDLFVMYNSTINSEKGVIVSANKINYYLKYDLIKASSNVFFQYEDHIFTGNELEYDMNSLLLKTYNGGKFIL